MKKIKVIIIGFGKVAAQNLNDRVMSKKFRFATHIQALQKNKIFQVNAVVDTNKKARKIAENQFKIKDVYSSIEMVRDLDDFDVAVISTPPEHRLNILRKLKNIKFLIIEKPLSLSFSESKRIYDYCMKNKIIMIVNFWRRFVPQFEKLANGMLKDLIGDVQSVNILYTDGLMNHGIHLIDFARFLIGEIKAIHNIKDSVTYKTSSLKNDKNVFFTGVFSNKIPLYGLALDSNKFRENGMEIFGTKAKLSIINDCREMFIHGLQKHRGVSGFSEINYKKARFMKVDFDLAMFNLYKNLSEIIKIHQKNISPLSSALRNERLINMLLNKRYIP